MNRNQLPPRHRTGEEDLQPLKLLVFIANVKEQPQLAKHGIADLGPLQHLAVVEEDHQSLREGSQPRQDRVFRIVRKDLALIEVSFLRNRAE